MDLTLKQTFSELESLMGKEKRSFWDVNTLNEYLTAEHIPQGLGIKKFPTFDLCNNVLKKEWTDALSACSFKLMRIIVRSKKIDLDRIQGKMSSIQKELSAQKDHASFF